MLAPVESGRSPGFTYMAFPGLLVYSCYWRPGGPLEEFEGFLAGLEVNIRRHAIPEAALIVAGDFNAKSPEWGSETLDARGRALGLFMASLQLWPKNIGSTPTFAVGDRMSCIDVTLA